MLGACGVFWGALPDEYNESAFFQSLNEALFSMASATWDAPAPMEHYFMQPDHQKQALDFIQKRLKEGLYTEFCWGLDTRPIYGTDRLSGHWGWKDPRNVYTLGLWLAHFPNARVIHIIRNGIDVAISLWRRETSRPEGTDHPHYSQFCQTREGSFDLWKRYVHEARRWSDKVEHFLEIRFEELIGTPRATLERLRQFLDLRSDRRGLSAIHLIQPKSSLMHSSDAHMNDFINRARNDALMKTLGYSQHV